LSVGHFSGDGDDDRWSSKSVLVVSSKRRIREGQRSRKFDGQAWVVCVVCAERCLALFSDVEPLALSAVYASLCNSGHHF
jgi:hypothetical protein